jgi:hypothetical protein
MCTGSRFKVAGFVRFIAWLGGDGYADRDAVTVTTRSLT